ncbi:MAG: zf-HC2 domain-containing protein [Deltaproteobacteria bacterium]|nr:zf-HC2 domain-containing protein [Deltaproteobacteria bacterium]MBW2415560.1 zf-HC2 domain-containing protein [Deltaproteobacteria bacterium]
MTCQELADFLLRYLDGELPAPQGESFAEHLALCPPCKAYLTTYQKTVKLGQSVCADPEGPVPGDVPDELVEAILAARSRA